MAASRLHRIPQPFYSNMWRSPQRPLQSLPISRNPRAISSRTFTSSSTRFQQQEQSHRKSSFSSRLREALSKTKIQWRPIPAALGIGFLGFAQLYRIQRREQSKVEEELSPVHGNEGENGEPRRPRKRERIKPEGPWSVRVMSTLPLKAMSRVWGQFNELTIPYYLRVPGFKLYSWIFGVNLSEVAEPDLHTYPNLASFFYRTLKPGVRPLDPNPNALLSPADGKVVQFGTIEQGYELEQVKGITYKLEALLGSQSPSAPSTPPSSSSSSSGSSKPQPGSSKSKHAKGSGENTITTEDEEFARVNGISYTVPNLFSGPLDEKGQAKHDTAAPTDQSTTPKPASESTVRADLHQSAPSSSSSSLDSESQRPWWSPAPSSSKSKQPETTLYYIVVYLAPGDYHRFHSPVNWVVQSRRHFAGELYSVSPYLVRTLPGLFTLNERVVLLGRWRHGFFSYTPVGATNVGSIIINFDKELRTNSLTTDTKADLEAARAQERGEMYSGFSEASYFNASNVLGGFALKRGEEMGGFQLGSTIVCVFEAPKGRRQSLDQGWGFTEEGAEKRRGGWRWGVEIGEQVKVGRALGWVDEGTDEDEENK